MLSQSTNLYKRLQKRYSRRINLDLNRINKVLKKLNYPHLVISNPINILGSDGKMSVLTSIKYLLEGDKKKVTAFTSPHLYDVRHRFWLNDKYITINKIKELIKIIEKTKLKLTLFELLTCVYILAAKDQKNISYNFRCRFWIYYFSYIINIFLNFSFSKISLYTRNNQNFRFSIFNLFGL